MKSVLIVTQKTDPHTDAVIEEIEKLKFNVLRLNSENLLDFYSIKMGYEENANFYGFISDKVGRNIDLKKTVSAYYRKPIDVLPHPEIEIDGAKEFSSLEGKIALSFVYTFPLMKWVNNPFLNKMAQIKFGQLHTASKLGLRIPETIVTNNPEEASIFFRKLNYNVLCKSLQTNSVQFNQKPVHTFSHKLDKEEQEKHLYNIRLAPTLLQEYIEKKTEIRVNVLGDKVFATEIHSQSSDAGRHDWRKVNPWEVPHQPFDLPRKIEDALVRFVQLYGLKFGAIDLIRTHDDDFVFLENNPNGQWYWIELITKQPIAKAVAELLCFGL